VVVDLFQEAFRLQGLRRRTMEDVENTTAVLSVQGLVRQGSKAVLAQVEKEDAGTRHVRLLVRPLLLRHHLLDPAMVDQGAMARNEEGKGHERDRGLPRLARQ